MELATGFGAAGSFFSLQKQFIKNGFSVDFTYRTSELSPLQLGEPADGIAFVVQDNVPDGPSSLGGGGKHELFLFPQDYCLIFFFQVVTLRIISEVPWLWKLIFFSTPLIRTGITWFFTPAEAEQPTTDLNRHLQCPIPFLLPLSCAPMVVMFVFESYVPRIMILMYSSMALWCLVPPLI